MEHHPPCSASLCILLLVCLWPTFATDQNSYVSCSEQDVLIVVQRSAEVLATKFVQAMDDVQLMEEVINQTNKQGGLADPVLRNDMCCCNSWNDTGTWKGYHDCSPNRNMEIFYGNVSMDDVHGVFTNNRSIDTDLAFIGAASAVFPWIKDRQNALPPFNTDFYSACWIGTSGEVWSYYPSFGPKEYFGDYIGGNYNGRNDTFVRPTVPQINPQRKKEWTAPYVDPAGAGIMISVVTPIYFTGEFHGHRFEDTYVAAMGIDMKLNAIAQHESKVRPTKNSLPMVINDVGNLISAPQDVVTTIFGVNKTIKTLEDSIECAGQGTAMSQQKVACSIADASQTGEWDQLVIGIANSPKGERKILGNQISVTRDGVTQPHTAGFYRWDGGGAPPWTSVVLVPTHELEGAARWDLVPEQLSVKVEAPGETARTQFALVNTGTVNLTYSLIQQPDYMEVLEPKGHMAHGGTGLLNALVPEVSPFPVDSRIEYTVELKAARAGTHRQSLIWLIEDDGYPDCFVQNKVTMEVEFTVPTTSETWILPTVVGLGSLLFVIAAGSSARFLFRRHRQLRALQQEREQMEVKNLSLAKSMLDTMAFPMHLVLAKHFLEQKQLTVYEELRDKGLHKVVDKVRDLCSDKFGVANNPFVFFSHQWTGFREPDADGIQFGLMCDSLRDLIQRKDIWHDSNLYVWVDYCCIPQQHAKMQELAIMSLPVYSSKASAFVIVAPDVQHQDTKEMCDFSTYKDRAWCRTEQASHSMCRGAKHLYIVKEKETGMGTMERDLLEEALRVFDGNLTCCRLKHKGMVCCDKERLVLPMLSVYANLRRQQRRGQNSKMMNMLSEKGENKCFPTHFDFVTENSEGEELIERRLLFGDLVEKMKESIDAEDLESIGHLDSIEARLSDSSAGSTAGRRSVVTVLSSDGEEGTCSGQVRVYI